MSNPYRWRIATTIAGLQMGSMIARGLPVPDQISLVEYSQIVDTPTGGSTEEGFSKLEVLWVTLDPYQAFVLKDLINTVGRQNFIYLTINRADADYPGAKFVDIRGYPRISPIAPEQPLAGSRGYMHRNVKLDLNNVVVINSDPTF